jgi:hypothetical protein
LPICDSITPQEKVSTLTQPSSIANRQSTSNSGFNCIICTVASDQLRLLAIAHLAASRKTISITYFYVATSPDYDATSQSISKTILLHYLEVHSNNAG